MSTDRNAVLPVPYRVVFRHAETDDAITLRMQPVHRRIPAFEPGQFTMLYAHGVGEIAVSISGDPTARDHCLTQTVRDVGAVSRAVNRAHVGDIIGVRGPFGVGWGLDSATGHDLVLVAGGLGLAPLRPVILHVLAHREQFGTVVLVAGARSPEEFLFRDQLIQWRVDPRLDILLTVDQPTIGWRGPVGFVTEPLGHLRIDADHTMALLCGPEPMMRYAANLLRHKGVAASNIRLSLERNMKCGMGTCGHCQLGPLLVCRDGPILDYACVGPLLGVREL